MLSSLASAHMTESHTTHHEPASISSGVPARFGGGAEDEEAADLKNGETLGLSGLGRRPLELLLPCAMR